MNGEEHYRKAEQLIDMWDNGKGDEFIRAALVHATLAQAAASVQYLTDGRPETVDARGWRRMLTQDNRPPTSTDATASYPWQV